MKELIVNALISYFLKVLTQWLSENIQGYKDRKENKELIEKQKSATTEEERRNANRNLANDLGN